MIDEAWICHARESAKECCVTRHCKDCELTLRLVKKIEQLILAKINLEIKLDRSDVEKKCQSQT